MIVTTRATRRAAALAAVIAACLAAPAAQAREPDATVEFKGGAVALGLGYSWASGVLHYQGQDYPLHVNGLSAIDIGASKYTATGRVYNLKQPSDIAGVYAAMEAGAAVAGGGATSGMKNSKGVVIGMNQSRQGVQFNLGPKGMSIGLK